MDNNMVKELFKGIAVIIDDQVDEESANIKKIIDQLDKENMPYIKYKELPSDEIIKNFQSISFVLLDWKLINNKDLLDESVRIPEELKKDNDKANIEFLKKLKETCFCPVFIFTNENIDDIKTKLKDASLHEDDKCSIFLIKNKVDFEKEGSLFEELEKWLKESLSIYLLKEWDNAYQKAKSKLFIDFQNRSPYWVKIIWKTFEDDGVNPDTEMGELIAKNILSMTSPLKLDKKLFELKETQPNIDEIISCMERQVYISSENLDNELPCTGDIFKKGKKYYVNIRPSCDLIPRGENKLESIELYLLECEKLKKSKTEEFYDKKYNKMKDSDTFYLVFPFVKANILKIKFKKMKIKNWQEINDERYNLVGRLLHPYLTKLQIKYAAYFQRQGLPRIPKEIFELMDNNKSEKEANNEH